MTAFASRAGAHVAFFDYVTHFGGAQRSTVELVTRLGEAVEVCVWDAYGSCADYLRALSERDVPTHVLLPGAKHQTIGFAGRGIMRMARFGRSLPEQARLAHRVRSLFRRTRPDIVWTNSRKGFLLLAASAPRHARLAFFLRGGELSLPSVPFVRRVLRPRAARVLVLTSGIGAAVAARGYPADRIRVVPNAISVDDVVAQSQLPLAAELPQARRPVRLLMAGTLVPNKGQLEGVQVLHRLVTQGVDAVLYLAGDAPDGAAYTDTIRSAAITLGVDDRVEFLGWRSDGLSVLRQSSVLLLLSLSEGIPRVVLEAMAVGVPVVATPAGGVVDLIRHRQTGWLVSREDPAGIVQAIIEATGEARDSVARQAREYVAREYSPRRQMNAALAALLADEHVLA